MKDEALRLALEALEDYKYAEARTIIREALEQPAPYRAVKTYHGGKPWYVQEPEPVADPEKHPQFYTWTWDEWVSGGKWLAEFGWKKPKNKATNLQPLYTSPPKREWQGLTDEEMKDALVSVDAETKRLPPGFRDFARAIASKLREKNA